MENTPCIKVFTAMLFIMKNWEGWVNAAIKKEQFYRLLIT